jgi:hypothetical protein
VLFMSGYATPVLAVHGTPDPHITLLEENRSPARN